MGGADPYTHTADMAPSFSALGFGGAFGCTNGTESGVSTNTEGREYAPKAPNVIARVSMATEAVRCHVIGRDIDLTPIHAHCGDKSQGSTARAKGTHAT
jgi:hypothetical protein